MRLSLWSLCLFVLIQSCEETPAKNNEHNYNYHDVGDINHDPSKDQSTFTICDSTDIDHRRNSIVYPEGKDNMKAIFMTHFQKDKSDASFTGYIIVRFLINCNGETGRFRHEVINMDFSPSECSSSLTDHIINIVQKLDQWGAGVNRAPERDHSKYINFKIIKGELQSVHL